LFRFPIAFLGDLQLTLDMSDIGSAKLRWNLLDPLDRVHRLIGNGAARIILEKPFGERDGCGEKTAAEQNFENRPAK